MPELNETPSANRLHIGIFGKTNSGKSSFINAFTNQAVSIVADVAGTTTDPVYKAMELHPLGPCEIIDTAGFDDVSELGEKRVEKTRLAAEKSDIAVIVISATQEDYEQELSWCEYFKLHHTPVLIVLNKTDLSKKTDVIIENLTKKLKEQIIPISAKSGEGIQDVKTEMIRLIPENHGQRLITGNLVAKSDLVLLVMPQDIQAPKGRLILPQVQTIRELLDRQCMVMCVTTDQLEEALRNLTVPP
ncbi:MAG: GTP-binding protein, partial [Clostridia bacterium]|nr:GTP-binding protein [Clostridia bacterium]